MSGDLVRLSLLMGLEYAIWGAWLPVLAVRLLGPLNLGRQGIPHPGLEIQLRKELVRGARRHGGGHGWILEDGPDRADERAGVEQGPVRPHHRGGQQHQEAGKRDQQGDDASADAAQARLADSFVPAAGSIAPSLAAGEIRLSGRTFFGRLD